MEIIHDLSKLKIETTDSSSSQEEDEQKEMKRNWLELPPDVMSLIFLKLGYIYILGSAQWVCSSWWKLSKQPHLFRSIHVEKVVTLFERSLKRSLNINQMNRSTKFSKDLAREAIDRSCGQLVEFSIRGIPIDELLHYMSEKSSSLRSLLFVNVELWEVYGPYCNRDITSHRLIEVAKKLPHLEELGIINCSQFSKDLIETFGRFCPQLKLFRLNFVKYIWPEVSSVSIVIAENMPELRHLNLLGNSLTDDDDLRAILDGCPHLESLDLRGCAVEFGGDFKERCKNIKVLRLPCDPIDDYEYELDEEYDSDDRCGDDYPSEEYSDYECVDEYSSDYASDHSLTGLITLTDTCPYNFYGLRDE